MNTFVPPRSSPALVGDCCNTAELPLNRNPSSQWPDSGDDVDNGGDGDGGDNDDGDGGVPMMMNTNNKPIESSCSWSAEMCWSKRQIWGKKHFWRKKNGSSNPSIESSSASKQSPHSWLLLVIPIASLKSPSYWPSSEYIGIDNGIGQSVVIWSLILLVLWYYQIWSLVLLYLSIVHLFVHHWTCDAASTW